MRKMRMAAARVAPSMARTDPQKQMNRVALQYLLSWAMNQASSCSSILFLSFLRDFLLPCLIRVPLSLPESVPVWSVMMALASESMAEVSVSDGTALMEGWKQNEGLEKSLLFEVGLFVSFELLSTMDGWISFKLQQDYDLTHFH